MGEIRAALHQLSDEQLRELDSAIRQQFRDRQMGILYDDAYGQWTEEDQSSSGAAAFAVLDSEVKPYGPS